NDMTVVAGQDAGQLLSATNVDERALSFYKVVGPSYMNVSTDYTLYRFSLGELHLTPQLTDSPTPAGGTFTIPAVVGVTDGKLSDTKSFTINITFPPDHPPVLQQPVDMTVTEGFPDEQFLTYSDPDGDPVTLPNASVP